MKKRRIIRRIQIPKGYKIVKLGDKPVIAYRGLPIMIFKDGKFEKI